MVLRKDVAERAGTSPAVVSYVLNGSLRPVAPGTRARVLKAVEELNYRPNRIARSLRMNKTMTIGLVSPDASNPFFAELSNAIEDAAFKRGYTILIGNSAEDLDRQGRYLDAFAGHQVDGLLLVPALGTTEDQVGHIPRDRPLVLIDRSLPGTTLPRVLVDNRDGAARATEHLFEHGRTRIACIAGPADSSPSSERVAGFLATVRAHRHLADASDIVRHGPFGRHSGYLAALDLLEGRRVDALFATSDEQAFGVLRAIFELGLTCPRDVAVVSFDGIAGSAYTVPSLTSIAQPFSSIGTAAIGLLLDLIEKRAPAQPLTELKSELVRRGSCGCEDRHRDASDRVMDR